MQKQPTSIDIISNDESTPKTKGKGRAISHANVEKKTVDSNSDELESQIDPRVISTTSLSKMLQILIRFITNQAYYESLVGDLIKIDDDGNELVVELDRIKRGNAGHQNNHG